MNMVVKLVEVECRGPMNKSGVQQPPIRAYMDDLTITPTYREQVDPIRT